MKNLLKNWKWYELVFLVLSFVAIILCFAFTTDRNYLSLFCSLIGVFYVLLSSKGVFWAPVAGLVYNIIYIIMAISQQYYGEVLVTACCIMPLQIFTVLKWLKYRNMQKSQEVIVKKLHWQEYLIVVLVALVASVGVYFILQALNTSELIINTMTFILSIVGTYLMFRRSSFYAIAFIINNIALIILWTISVINEGLEYLPMVISFAIFFLLNTYGLVRWQIAERKQNKSQSELAPQLNVDKTLKNNEKILENK